MSYFGDTETNNKNICATMLKNVTAVAAADNNNATEVNAGKSRLK